MADKDVLHAAPTTLVSNVVQWDSGHRGLTFCFSAYSNRYYPTAVLVLNGYYPTAV